MDRHSRYISRLLSALLQVRLTEDYIEFQLPTDGRKCGKDLVGVSGDQLLQDAWCDSARIQAEPRSLRNVIPRG